MVVIGCGPVGLCAISCAAYLSKKHSIDLCIIALDSVPVRLQVAKTLGASHALDFTLSSTLDFIRESSASGAGADYVLEIVGQKLAMKYAVNCVRPGGIISSVGVHAYKENQMSPIDAYDKNITFRCGRCPVRSILSSHSDDLFGILNSMDTSSLFTHRVSLSQVENAFALFNEQKDGMIKCLIDFDF